MSTPMTQANKDVLRALINVGPNYAPHVPPATPLAAPPTPNLPHGTLGDMDAVTVELNTVRAGATVSEVLLDGREVLRVLDQAEVEAKAASVMVWLNGILAHDVPIDVSTGSPARAQLNTVFNSTDWPVSRPNLIAILDRDGSDFEVELGAGVTADRNDVGTIWKDGA